MNDHDEVLDGAKAAINGPRAQAYGGAREGFQRTAELWGAQGVRIDTIDVDGQAVYRMPDASDVAQLLILLKLSRLAASPDHFDSIMDIAGYAALLARVTGAKPMVDTLGHPIMPEPAKPVDDRIVGGWAPTHRIADGTYETHLCRIEKLVDNRAYVTILDKHNVPFIADLPTDYLSPLR